MATYTVKINERTEQGKNFIPFLKSLTFVTVEIVKGSAKSRPNTRLKRAIKEADDKGFSTTTLNAIGELKSGKVTRCKTFDDYLKAVK